MGGDPYVQSLSHSLGDLPRRGRGQAQVEEV